MPTQRASSATRSEPRQTGEIGYQSTRGGDVAGEHTVRFLGDGERVELAHIAGDANVFARGALRAARWLIGRPAGRYGMSDVLAGTDP
jgi:4-hydroxy-tetrahydrodipicolinate reductase